MPTRLLKNLRGAGDDDDVWCHLVTSSSVGDCPLKSMCISLEGEG
jgi:hypothetical protein